jgi:hypothetical protein
MHLISICQICVSRRRIKFNKYKCKIFCHIVLHLCRSFIIYNLLCYGTFFYYEHFDFLTIAVLYIVVIYMGSVNSIWGKSKARAPYWIHWPCIYRIRSLAHCVTNISYWLPLNEGFRLTASKLININTCM